MLSLRFLRIAKIGKLRYVKLLTLINIWSITWYKTVRICYFLGLELHFFNIDVLWHLRREISLRWHIMPLQCVALFIYATLYVRPDICFTIGMVGRYNSNPGLEHLTIVKLILKYLWRKKNYVFVFHSVEIIQSGDMMVNKILLWRTQRILSLRHWWREYLLVTGIT